MGFLENRLKIKACSIRWRAQNQDAINLYHCPDQFRTKGCEALFHANFENVDKLRSKLTNAGLDVQIGRSNVTLVQNARFSQLKVTEILDFYGLS